MKPFKEVINGIRKAVMASEVREDIAQMGEYVEQFANTAGENIQKAIDPTLSLSGKAADAAKVGEAVGQLEEDKVSKPSIADNNKIPRANNGDVEWVEVGQPTDEQTNSAVTKWLDEHPEATTTVQNGSLSYSHFVPTEILNEKDMYDIAIGEKQNSLEQKYTYPNLINFGEPNEPPMLKELKNKGFDIIAHFYNDFGLKSTALSAEQDNGSYIWYDWSWNFTTKETYDPKRHPLLGFYQGDDRKTLDWILYWLGNAGVNVLSLVGEIDTTNWNNPSNINYWKYVLLNECKNINCFKIVPWFFTKYGATVETYQEKKSLFQNFVENYSDMIYSYTINGKTYGCIYTWETEAIRGTFDGFSSGSTSNSKLFLKSIADIFKNNGFDGVIILARNGGTLATLNDTYIDDGYVLYKADYINTYGNSTYQEYAESDVVLDQYKVADVFTSGVSSAAHPSKYNCVGSTPELFSKRLNKVIDAIEKYKAPRMLTIYNVSEWAEGGAGLIPNVFDGFGYLNAVASCRTIIDNINPSYLERNILKSTRQRTKDNVYAAKKIETVNGGTDGKKTVYEFADLYQLFSSEDNLSNYCVESSLFSMSTPLDNLRCYAMVNPNTRRVYGIIMNEGDKMTSLNDVYLCLSIHLIN